MGLYNGKFDLENGNIQGTQITISQFEQQIKEIREDLINNFPSQLPRQTAAGIGNNLKKKSKIDIVMSAGSFLNGEFITWNFTWNTSYVPVQIHYNPSGAPSSAPDANTIASLANIAFSLWADAFFF